jgi:hypothetical protein
MQTPKKNKLINYKFREEVGAVKTLATDNKSITYIIQDRTQESGKICEKGNERLQFNQF